MKKVFVSILLISVFSFVLTAQKETKILIKTEKGNIKLKLYNETPKHRDNLVKLISQKYYDGLLFHRVIKDFMVQGGDPDSKNAAKGAMLGNNGPGYTIPAEINSKFFHKKGALAAARLGDDQNPKKESSGSQFYIVQGKKFTEQELAQLETNMNQQNKMQFYIAHIRKPENKALYHKIDSLQRARNTQAIDLIIADLDKTIGKNIPAVKMSDAQKKAYTTIGGAPHLDGTYTVFGEVIEGLDVVDKIAQVAVDGNSRPNEDVKIITIDIIK